MDDIKHTIHACGPCGPCGLSELTTRISLHFPHANYPESDIDCELWLRIGWTNFDMIF